MTSTALQDIAAVTRTTITSNSSERVSTDGRQDSAAGLEITAVGPTPASVAEAAMLIRRTVEEWSRALAAATTVQRRREGDVEGMMPQLLGLFTQCFPFGWRRRSRQ